jgi:hypothetical protein
MTTAQRELLRRIADGEDLHWVHPATATGRALLGDGARKAHACLRAGWLRVRISSDYLQPVELTESGRHMLATTGQSRK